MDRNIKELNEEVNRKSKEINTRIYSINQLEKENEEIRNKLSQYETEKVFMQR